MTDKKDSSKNPISQEDSDLWQEMTSDVERMPGKSYTEIEPEERKQIKEATIRETVLVKKEEERPPSRFKSKDVDRKTLERLRRGKLDIDATLDLHGLTQDEAYPRLMSFTKIAYERGYRCILIITGKGRTKPGVLRKRVPMWLEESEISPFILHYTTAKQHDGGEGALYVLIRRKR